MIEHTDRAQQENPVQKHLPDFTGRIRIDENTPVFKEGSPSASLRIGWEGDKKVLLKTLIFFVDRQTKKHLPYESAVQNIPGSTEPNMRRQNLDYAISRLKTEENVSQIADWLGAPMAKTRFGYIHDTAYAIYNYIEGVEDRGFGNARIHFVDNEHQLLEQEHVLAMSGILKILLGANGDGGQYLQDPMGNIMLSDLALDMSVPVAKPEELLIEILAQNATGYGFLCTAYTAFQHQFAGLRAPAVQQVLQKLEHLSEEDVKRVPGLVPRIQSAFLARAHALKRVIDFLLQHQSLAEAAINPLKQKQERLVPRKAAEEAAQQLRALFTS